MPFKRSTPKICGRSPAQKAHRRVTERMASLRRKVFHFNEETKGKAYIMFEYKGDTFCYGDKGLFESAKHNSPVLLQPPRLPDKNLFQCSSPDWSSDSSHHVEDKHAQEKGSSDMLDKFGFLCNFFD